MAGGEEDRTGPHLSSARRPFRSSGSFLFASSTLAFSRSALASAEATGWAPKPGPSRSRSSRLGLASGSRPREEGPWGPGVKAWASSSEGTGSSFFAEEVVTVATGIGATSFLVSWGPTGPGPPSSFPTAGALRPESSEWPRLGIECAEPLAWARSCKEQENRAAERRTHQALAKQGSSQAALSSPCRSQPALPAASACIAGHPPLAGGCGFGDC